MVGINQAQIHRYEKGAAEPSMSALNRIALTLGVTVDELVFEEVERGPDDDLRLQFDAITQFTPEEKKAARLAFARFSSYPWSSFRLRTPLSHKHQVKSSCNAVPRVRPTVFPQSPDQRQSFLAAHCLGEFVTEGEE